MPSPPGQVRLWLHECQRVFMDRMISEEDVAKLGEPENLNHESYNLISQPSPLNPQP